MSPWWFEIGRNQKLELESMPPLAMAQRKNMLCLLIAILQYRFAGGLLRPAFTSLAPRRPIACHRQHFFRHQRRLAPLRASNDDVGCLPSALHHAAFKTRNITNAIDFYSLLGFEVQHKFRAGPARAAWLQLPASGGSSTARSRIEVIEVPGYMLQEEPGTRKRALDLMKRPDFLGWNHVALDVTEMVVEMNNKNPNATDTNLWGFMKQLNATSWQRFGRTLRIAVEPKQQLIGNEVYELGFIYDADGCLVEFLYKQAELEQEIDSGWEPWDGTGFVGAL